MAFLRTLSLFFLISLFFVSCGGDDNGTDPNDQKPEITSITPNHGPVGTEVEIYGTGFGDIRGAGFVKINETVCGNDDYLNWTDTKIKIVVPEGATSGKLYVKAKGQESNKVNFTVAEEGSIAIFSLDPESGSHGDEVTIKGQYFGDDRNGYVTFNETMCSLNDYLSWSDTEIVVTVPEGAKSGDVVVFNGENTSNGMEFTIIAPPAISDLSQFKAAQGMEIIIYGKNFGDKRGESFVQFGNTRAAESDYEDWTDTRINVKVPENAKTGKIFVVVNGYSSNKIDFEIGEYIPEISSLSKTDLKIGEEVTITGKNFGSVRGDSYVQFTGDKVFGTGYKSWSDNSITVEVPGDAVSGEVKVVVSDIASNGINVTISADNPFIEDMQPRNPLKGEKVSIYGKNFGSSRGSNYLEFAGVQPSDGDYVSWSNTKIEVLFPFGAGEGDVVVYVDGIPSNGFPYSVIENIVPLEMISSGNFIMGDDNGGDWDGPEHEVTISYDYYMSKTEVTQEQWQAVMSSASNPSRDKGPQRPVERVEWFRAIEFCNKLSEIEGLTPCYTITVDPPTEAYHVQCNFDADGYRLPTEAEWEYAARAASTGDFAGTGNIDDMGWTSNDGLSHTKEVALKQPNQWGLYDMHGNVAEWCWDAFDSFFYSDSPKVDPRLDPAPGYPEVVIRGGSYQDTPEKCTSAYRNGLSPSLFPWYVGFRVVRKK